MITVDMSINVTYPNLKPHLHELAELIAKELDIDSRQASMVYKIWYLLTGIYVIDAYSVRAENSS